MTRLPAIASILAVLAVPTPDAFAQSTVDTKTCVIRGRFVEAETGKPIARCNVKLTGHESTGTALAWSLGDWADPPTVTTGPDGGFRFAIRLPVSEGTGPRSRYHIDATHVRKAPWFSLCSFTVAAEMGKIDYGDILLPVGVRPRIRVVDTDRKPQAGVLLTLREQLKTDPFIRTPAFGPRSWVPRGATLRTDIDGYLHPRNPLPKGAYTLEVKKREVHKLPERFELPSPEAITVIVKTIAKDDIIEGKVVDTTGLPVAGAKLAVNASGRRTRFYSRRDGRFTVLRPKGNDDDEARVQLTKKRGYVDVARLQWGERNAVIEVAAGTKVTFAVTSREGKPVSEFNLYCLPVDERGPLIGVRRSGRFAGGRLRCRLAPGRYKVMVYPRGPGAVPTDWQPIEIGDKELTEKIELPTAVTRSIRVRVGNLSRAGTRVEAVYGPRPDRWEELFTIQRIVGRVRVPATVLVAAGRTDAEGRIELRAPEPDREVFLRISGPGINSTVHDVTDAWGRREAIAIQAAPGATLRGVLGPIEDVDALDISTEEERAKHRVLFLLADLLAGRRPSIVVFVGASKERWADRHFPVDEKGRFEIDGLPPGKVRLGLLRFVRKGERTTGWHSEIHDFGEFAVDTAKPKEVELVLPKTLRRKGKSRQK